VRDKTGTKETGDVYGIGKEISFRCRFLMPFCIAKYMENGSGESVLRVSTNFIATLFDLCDTIFMNTCMEQKKIPIPAGAGGKRDVFFCDTILSIKESRG